MQRCIWPWKWLDTKSHYLCCMNCILAGKISKEFEIRYLARKPCTAPQLYANSPPLKKYHLYTRGQVDFKNMILPLHEKHKKKCFLRSMGSTISIFSTPLQRNIHFFFGKITAEGCQKRQNMILTLHEKQRKKRISRSMRSMILIFATPLE